MSPVEDQLPEFTALADAYAGLPSAVGCVTQDLTFLAMSRRFADNFGIKDQDPAGRSLRELMPQFSAQLEPLIAQVCESTRPIKNAAITDPRAESASAARTWRVDVLPARGPHGAVRCANVVVGRTESVSASGTSPSEQRFRALEAASSLLVWRTAPDGQIEDMPEWRAYTGQTKDEVKGWGWLNAVNPDDQVRTAEVWQAAVDARGLYETEYRIRRYDGVDVWHQARGIPILDDDGDIREWVGVCIDIDQRKRASDALDEARRSAEQASRAKGEFLANMSHEIRTPMNAIIGMSSLALTGDLPGRERSYVEKAHRAALSLLGILNDILDVTKVEAGKMTLERSPFDLEEMLAECGDVVGLAAAERELEFRIDVADDVPPTLVGDSMRLRQVLVNLGNNAVKFTEAGTIALSITRVDAPPQPEAETGAETGAANPTGGGESAPGRRDPHSVRLHFAVSDTGIGMSPDVAARVFETFTQADSSTTREFGGFGLGLSISRNLVLLMGGEIAIDSTLGRGSTLSFEIELPVADDHVAEIHGGRFDGRQILVVAADEATRATVTQWLSDAGGTVQGAADIRAARRSLHEVDTPDLVILDQRLADGAGLELLRELSPPPHGPAVVVTSAYGTRDISHDARELGLEPPRYFLTKPLLRRHTLRTLHAAMSTSPSHVTEHPPAPVIPDLTGTRILLVEDNALNQELALEVLASRAHASVDVAMNGEEALARLESAAQPYDLVLMDCQMPVMDGYEATRRMRADPRWRTIPVIAMTASALVPDREAVHGSGMDGFIAKPVDIPELFSTLAAWLPSR